MTSRGKKILGMVPSCSSETSFENNLQQIEETIVQEPLFDSDDSVKDADYLPDSDDSVKYTDYIPDPSSPENSDPGHRLAMNTGTTPEENTFPVTNDGEEIHQKNSWKKNVRKNKKNAGDPYINSKGHHVPGRFLGEPCNNSCRIKCSTRIRQEERTNIFISYWNLSNIDRQRDFVNNSVEVTDCKRRTTATPNNLRRFKSMKFYLKIKDSRINVCRTMLLNTLGIKKGFLNFAIKKRILPSNITEKDKRGGYGTTKIPDAALDFLKQHIKKFPTVASHYCRKDSRKMYLDPKLNIKQMYRLYKEECTKENKEYLKESYYRHIFRTHFSLSFHKPRKDQCPTCTSYEAANAESKASMLEQYNFHIKNKERARNEKNLDKAEAKETPEKIHSANFDLQQVLYVPTDPTNPILFYKTKLATYNFTIFNCGNNIGKCYMWSEVEGSRGPCEIASCLFHHLKSLPASIENVRLFSDTCGGQNKNQFVAAMFIYAVQVLQINIIDQKFLVSGHSQMECDSMHARIETVAKNVPVYLPHEWVSIAQRAKQNNPKYQVFQKADIGFLDWKTLAKLIMVNRNKDADGNVVNWHHIKWIRYEKESPFEMKIKTDLDEDFRSIMILPRRGRRVTVGSMEACLKPLHTEKKPISALKLKHLKEICNSGSVPEDCRLFFTNLLAEEGIQDETVVPDVNDPEEENFFSQ
ncbi:unnamed protein product [Psylliodes chrysocephalus]|uniref:DUF7869 domain-containing protein n=1 Tax=Psylliodes chrysocephalus TaxID=3402493 RepID=A0A9P0CWB2_9CUCU|nr:unnamed protein product [Psylliodes chrysocephala]